MRTPASINGHPVHPMLVTIPIGLWIFSLAADVIYFGRLTSNPDLWRNIAFFTMAGGIAGALLAAVPGFIDLLSVQDKGLRKIGIIHMVLNLFTVALYAVNWILRLTQATDLALPFVMSIVGVLVLFVSGWLGATLVHEHRMGVTEGPQRPA